MGNNNVNSYKGRFSKRINRYVFLSLISVMATSFILSSSVYLYTLQNEIKKSDRIAVNHKTQQIDITFDILANQIKNLASEPRIITSLLEYNFQSFDSFIQDKKRPDLLGLSIFDNHGSLLAYTGENYLEEFKDKIVLKSSQHKVFKILSKNSMFLVAPIQYYGKKQGFLAAYFDLNLSLKKLHEKEEYFELYYNHIKIFSSDRDINNLYKAGSSHFTKNTSIIKSPNIKINVFNEKNPYYQILITSIVLILLSILFSTFTSIYLAKKIGFLISGPIEVLVDRIQNTHLKEGNISCYPIGSNDDFEIIAIAFDEKNTENIKANSHLEEKVKIRTADLEKEKNRAEQALIARSEFIANMSHEIRTPLNGIIGSADFMINDEASNYPKEKLRVIEKSSKLLLSIISDILDFSKIEEKKLSLESLPSDIQKITQEVALIFISIGQKKSVAIRTEFKNFDSPLLLCDPTRLSQILLNLIGNSVKFTHEGHILTTVETIKKTESHHTIKFSVQDTGIGISPHRLNKLFQPFEQEDSSTTRRYGGTGLGLTICKRIIELMGSEIHVHSIQNEGTTFSFAIEMSLTKNHILENNDTHKLTSEAQKLQILVAEDNSTNRDILGAFLEKFKLSFVFAHDGVEAVTKSRNQKFDVILMDMQMPNLDGVDATTQIRNSENHASKNAIIIAMTANALPEDKERCFIAGMNRFVTKPITSKKIIAELNSCALKISSGN
ncbi:MAG: ATP-binding protein [Oligoflexales bacterium]